MVANTVGSYDSLHSPLLGDSVDRPQTFGSTGSQRGEVVVDVPSESQSQNGIAPDEALATQSRNTFQQLHALNRTRSSDFSRSGSKRRRHSVRNPIQTKSLVARAAYSAKTDTWNFLYNLLIGLFMWPKWSWDAMKKNSNLTILAAKQGMYTQGIINVELTVLNLEPFHTLFMFHFCLC